ncbi:MAG: PIN domain-containing protein [candidate division NC10 bacterium]|nr:PIN domain-containing protein [candidate division NC10 bacterium]
MSVVFVDTGAWLALMVKRDQYHAKAAAHYRQLSKAKRELLTTNYILVETYTKIRYDDGLEKAIRFHAILTQALQGGKLHLEWITPQLHEEAWQIFKRYQDQEFSFVDCTSFVVARRTGVAEIFGFDQGFRTMGFILKPGRPR